MTNRTRYIFSLIALSLAVPGYGQQGVLHSQAPDSAAGIVAE